MRFSYDRPVQAVWWMGDRSGFIYGGLLRAWTGGWASRRPVLVATLLNGLFSAANANLMRPIVSLLSARMAFSGLPVASWPSGWGLAGLPVAIRRGGWRLAGLKPAIRRGGWGLAGWPSVVWPSRMALAGWPAALWPRRMGAAEWPATFPLAGRWRAGWNVAVGQRRVSGTGRAGSGAGRKAPAPHPVGQGNVVKGPLASQTLAQKTEPPEAFAYHLNRPVRRRAQIKTQTTGQAGC